MTLPCLFTFTLFSPFSVKLASTRYLDDLPTEGGKYGQAFRCRETEDEILQLTRELGIGAQFGGKYFCHDVRVIRLPRHGASCPVGIGVSCSADRQVCSISLCQIVCMQMYDNQYTQTYSYYKLIFLSFSLHICMYLNRLGFG